MFLASDHRPTATGAEPTVAVEPAFSVSHDERLGLLRVVGVGVWDAVSADRHFSALENKLSQIRARDAQVRVLVDLRRSGPQPPETMDRIREWTGRLYLPGDRVAIILASSLAKAAMRGVASSAKRELFLSDTAAYTWVMAYA